jgi:hypothetical protein
MTNETNNHQEKINYTSFHERQEYWKDTPESERMDTWRKEMNAFLNTYKTDPAKKQD